MDNPPPGMGPRYGHKGHAGGCTVGWILIVVGVVFLIESQTDTRTELIAQYNAAVDDWNNIYRAQFVNSTSPFYYSTSWSDNGTVIATSGTYASSTAADSLNDSPGSGESFHSYTPYKFLTDTSTIEGNLLTAGQSATLNVTDSQGNVVFSTTGWTPNVVSTVSVSCSSSETKSYGSSSACLKAMCTKKGSQYYFGSDNQCHYVSYASRTCLSLSLSSGQWTSGQGCYSEDGGYTTRTQTTNTAVPGQLRSVHDPYVVASSLTGGSYYFGLTVTQKKTIAITLLVIGSLTVVGTFIMWVIYVLVCCGLVFSLFGCCPQNQPLIAPKPAPAVAWEPLPVVAPPQGPTFYPGYPPQGGQVVMVTPPPQFAGGPPQGPPPQFGGAPPQGPPQFAQGPPPQFGGAPAGPYGMAGPAAPQMAGPYGMAGPFGMAGPAPPSGAWNATGPRGPYSPVPSQAPIETGDVKPPGYTSS